VGNDHGKSEIRFLASGMPNQKDFDPVACLIDLVKNAIVAFDQLTDFAVNVHQVENPNPRRRAEHSRLLQDADLPLRGSGRIVVSDFIANCLKRMSNSLTSDYSERHSATFSTDQLSGNSGIHSVTISLPVMAIFFRVEPLRTSPSMLARHVAIDAARRLAGTTGIMAA
jgi:hypothetical protein